VLFRSIIVHVELFIMLFKPIIVQLALFTRLFRAIYKAYRAIYSAI